MLRFARSYSAASLASRPPLAEILPTKRTIKRLLFDHDSRLNYRKYVPTITKIYENLDSDDLVEVPSSFKGSDLMLFRNVLKEIRTKTNTINKNLLKLENELIEYSANLGDNNAVTILAFECLKNPEINNEEDINHAKHLIKELRVMKHPLTLKLSGDLAYQTQNVDSAINFYNEFLTVESETMLAAEVYQSLGMLLFNIKDLNKAEYMFQRAIKLTTLDKLSYSYFHLGLLHDDDPKLARYYFERAASQGLVESFANLGFMELNVFQDAKKAVEWFKLGVELGDFNSMIGIFDSYMKIKDFDKAKRALDSIKLMISQRKVMTMQKFTEIRGSSVQQLNDHFDQAQKGNRWNI